LGEAAEKEEGEDEDEMKSRGGVGAEKPCVIETCARAHVLDHGSDVSEHSEL